MLSSFRFLFFNRPFLLFVLEVLFTVRERPRCSSRTTTLLFANNHVAVRERQIKTTSQKENLNLRTDFFGPKNETIRTTESQDNLGHHRLSLFTRSVTTDYNTEGQPDSQFRENARIRIL